MAADEHELIGTVDFFSSFFAFMPVFNKMKTLAIALFSSFQGKNWSVK